MKDFPRIHRPQKDDPAAVVRDQFAPRGTEILHPPSALTNWRSGDIVCFYGRGLSSRIIEAYTRGPSHVGIIVMIHDKPMLYESTTLCDLACEECHRKVQGV